MKTQMSIIAAFLLLGTVAVSADENILTKEQIEQQFSEDQKAVEARETLDWEAMEETNRANEALEADNVLPVSGDGAATSEGDIQPEGSESFYKVWYGDGSGHNGNGFVHIGGGAGQYSASTAYYNTIVGYSAAGYHAFDGERNSLFGASSGYRIINGAYDNTIFGAFSGFSLETGDRNTFAGSYSGYNNNASYNTFIGYRSGSNNTSGKENTNLGYQAGYLNQTAGNNVIIGSNAGYNNTASDNTFVGFNSGFKNTSGNRNVFSGSRSGYSNTTGYDNAFSGVYSGYSNTSGTGNVFTGNLSGYKNTTGSGNIFSGSMSGFKNTIGSGNVFLGAYSGYNNTSEFYNVFLGYMAGYNETSHNRLYIANSDTRNPLIYGEFDRTGGYAGLMRINGTLETVWSGSNTADDGLKNLLVLSANNSEADKESDAGFALRNEREGRQWNFRTHQNGTAFVATIAGTGGPEFTVKQASNNYQNVELYLGNGAKNVGGLWINASSRALKENIKELSTQDALAAFHKLQPVTYNYKSDKKEQVVGFIAEDVPELVSINSRDGLSAMDMVAVLTKVVQEQDKILKVQAEKIAKLETMQKRLAKVESLLINLALDTSTATKEKISLK